ncbi:MAG: PEPxxWA-CTERM sorting domain-containing protein [Sphingomonadaceae bacterium]
MAPAQATIVFSDNFNTENGGATALNFRGFTNFLSTGSRDVDLVATPNPFGITCAGGSGSCVDLDGSPGPGTLASRNSFAFNTGDVVRLSFLLGGSQRGRTDNWFSGFDFGANTLITSFGSNYFGTDTVSAGGTFSGFSVGTSVNSPDPFSLRSIFFTAGQAGSLTFNFGTDSADNVGPLLDNVSLDITAAVPEPATWMMLLAGFGLIGAAMRRRGAALTQRQLV